MFLPIGDTPQPPRGFVAWVNWALIAANVLVYVLLTLPLSFATPNPDDPFLRVLLDRIELPPGYLPSAWDVVVERWGFVPDRGTVTTLVSAMFMHASFAHVAGNMLFLWIYGDNVEHRLGRLPYLAAYLGTGAVATLAFAAVAGDGATPLVGASGAISGVLGCYFVMFPRNQVRLFVGLFPFLVDVWLVPAPLVLGFYVLVDNLLPLFLGGDGSVAYGAHLGGFVGGLVIAAVAETVLRRAEPPTSSSPLEAHLARAEALAASGQAAAAFQQFLLVLQSTEDPALVARARRGLSALPLHPRLRARLGLDPPRW